MQIINDKVLDQLLESGEDFNVQEYDELFKDLSFEGTDAMFT